MELPKGLSPYATIPAKFHKYTIRSCFEEYRDSGGACWVDADPAELSVTQSTGEITCMTRIPAPVGMPCGGKYVGPAPQFHDSPVALIDSLTTYVGNALDVGFLWCPPGCVSAYKINSNKWKHGSTTMSVEMSRIMSVLERSELLPLTVSTIHAALESEKTANLQAFEKTYPFPRTTVPSTGLYGTAHNNSYVDMSPFEKEKEPDMLSRTFLEEHIGFICACHTSHSYEAGKSRRVALDVAVRLLGYSTMVVLDGMKTRLPNDDKSPKTWTLYAMGQICKISEGAVAQLSTYHKVLSIGRDPGFGLYLRTSERICIILVSSGVLTKLCSNGVWADSSNCYKSDRIRPSVAPVIDKSGPDFHRACLSEHYDYIPFVEFDAAIRTSIASAQIPQAVCLPWCPATAMVSPIYTFHPIVTTKSYSRIMIEQEKEFDIASYMAGENLCVLYHNLDLTYEDSIVISKRYVQNGGFCTIAICRYLLPASDYVPPEGSMLCAILCKWWKSPCQAYCRHTKEYIETTTAVDTSSSPTGRIVSKVILKSGEQSVKVRSFEEFQPGNKLSTGHGQKGVDSVLMDYEDMPICYTKDGRRIIPDILVAVQSIISRQTVGQVYETGAGMEAVRASLKTVIAEVDKASSLGDEVRVMDGRTGQWCKTVMTPKDGLDHPVLRSSKATLGYVRLMNQSQMTRERHFTSHRSVGPNTLRTPTRRSKGGALRFGEMEVQAAVASGLAMCAEEIRNRGDTTLVLVCLDCQRLRLLHSCTGETTFVEVTLPYDTIVLDCVNKIVHNYSFKYTIEPDI
jgi:hypothetical protein